MGLAHEKLVFKEVSVSSTTYLLTSSFNTIMKPIEFYSRKVRPAAKGVKSMWILRLRVYSLIYL